jgi:hypothetical protein
LVVALRFGGTRRLDAFEADAQVAFDAFEADAQVAFDALVGAPGRVGMPVKGSPWTPVTSPQTPFSSRSWPT